MKENKKWSKNINGISMNIYNTILYTIIYDTVTLESKLNIYLWANDLSSTSISASLAASLCLPQLIDENQINISNENKLMKWTHVITSPLINSNNYYLLMNSNGTGIIYSFNFNNDTTTLQIMFHKYNQIKIHSFSLKLLLQN